MDVVVDVAVVVIVVAALVVGYFVGQYEDQPYQVYSQQQSSSCGVVVGSGRQNRLGTTPTEPMIAVVVWVVRHYPLGQMVIVVVQVWL